MLHVADGVAYGADGMRAAGAIYVICRFEVAAFSAAAFLMPLRFRCHFFRRFFIFAPLCRRFELPMPF